MSVDASLELSIAIYGNKGKKIVLSSCKSANIMLRSPEIFQTLLLTTYNEFSICLLRPLLVLILLLQTSYPQLVFLLLKLVRRLTASKCM
jgi:hypothetical protein